MKPTPVFVASVMTLLLAASMATAAPLSEQLKSAVESLPSCENFIRFDDQYVFAGFGSADSHDTSNLYVANIDQTKNLGMDRFNSWQLPSSALDLIRMGNTLYVLDPNGLEEWDFAKKLLVARHPSYNTGASFDQFSRPTGMAAYGDKIVITHGTLGVSVFDTVSKRIVFQTKLVQAQLPLESAAMDVTIQGNLAYILMDSVTLVMQGPQPFRGLIVLNLDTMSLESQMDGLDPGSDAIVSDPSKLIISFMGMPIWKYGMDDLMPSMNMKMLPNPERRVYQFPIKGNPTGKPAMDDQYYYTCFETPATPTSPNYHRIAVALDRAAINLN